jgi:hypothetical protein
MLRILMREQIVLNIERQKACRKTEGLSKDRRLVKG